MDKKIIAMKVISYLEDNSDIKNILVDLENIFPNILTAKELKNLGIEENFDREVNLLLKKYQEHLEQAVVVVEKIQDLLAPIKK